MKNKITQPYSTNILGIEINDDVKSLLLETEHELVKKTRLKKGGISQAVKNVKTILTSLGIDDNKANLVIEQLRADESNGIVKYSKNENGIQIAYKNNKIEIKEENEEMSKDSKKSKKDNKKEKKSIIETIKEVESDGEDIEVILENAVEAMKEIQVNIPDNVKEPKTVDEEDDVKELNEPKAVDEEDDVKEPKTVDEEDDVERNQKIRATKIINDSKAKLEKFITERVLDIIQESENSDILIAWSHNNVKHIMHNEGFTERLVNEVSKVSPEYAKSIKVEFNKILSEGVALNTLVTDADTLIQQYYKSLQRCIMSYREIMGDYNLVDIRYSFSLDLLRYLCSDANDIISKILLDKGISYVGDIMVGIINTPLDKQIIVNYMESAKLFVKSKEADSVKKVESDEQIESNSEKVKHVRYFDPMLCKYVEFGV